MPSPGDSATKQVSVRAEPSRLMLMFLHPKNGRSCGKGTPAGRRTAGPLTNSQCEGFDVHPICGVGTFRVCTAPQQPPGLGKGPPGQCPSWTQDSRPDPDSGDGEGRGRTMPGGSPAGSSGARKRRRSRHSVPGCRRSNRRWSTTPCRSYRGQYERIRSRPDVQTPKIFGPAKQTEDFDP